LGEITLKKAQENVDRWINQFEEGYWPPLSMLASLMEEVGEVARELNHREKIKIKKVTEVSRDFGLELADVLFSLLCLTNHYDIDLGDKFMESMEKFSIRDANRWTKKSNS